jgi:hypothetical protein
MAEYNNSLLARQKKFLLSGNPVAVLSGNEFAKKEGMTLTQQVTAYYNSIGNKAASPVYGEVILDKKGVDDDFAHGIGRMKAIAFAAVPDIIEKGIVILPLGKYKSDIKSLSTMLAAPIAIRDVEYVGTVVLRCNKSGNTRLYVHEVSSKQKLLHGSSNPTSMSATNQGVLFASGMGSSNPASMPATHQGDVTKILQKIIFTKFE